MSVADLIHKVTAYSEFTAASSFRENVPMNSFFGT